MYHYRLFPFMIALHHKGIRYAYNGNVHFNIFNVSVHVTNRKPIEVHFEELELTVKMPSDIDCYCMAIRALWVKYDHYSDCAISYNMPELPDEYESMHTIGKIVIIP